MTAPTTLAELRKGLTDPIVRAAWIAVLQSQGYPVNAWQDESANRALFEAFIKQDLDFASYAALGSRLNTLTSNIADAVEHYGRNFFQESRTAAIATRHQVTFTCAAGKGPWSPAPPSLIVKSGNVRFFLYSIEGTIPSGGSVNGVVEAYNAGEEGNVAVNSIDTMETTLDGVTVSNPAVAPAADSIVRTGVNRESLRAFRQRCRLKWALTSFNTVKAKAMAMALNAAPAVTKVNIDDQNPRGAGTVDIFIARESATATGGDVTAVQAAFDAGQFGATVMDGAGGTQRWKVYAADTLDLDITGTVYYSDAYTEAAVTAAVETALRALIADTDLGGNVYTDALKNILLRDEISSTMKATGVKAVTMTAPAANLAFALDDLLVEGDWSGITYTPVAA